jgi:glyoxylase-like metal-dependent hydrolase (beta-lactamase superfamily II)
VTLEQAAPGVRRLSLPLPIPALKTVNVYLVDGEQGRSLIDSGIHTEDAERALRTAVAEAGIALSDIQRTFVTHLHPDHYGMAGTLERWGSEIVMHRPEAERARHIWAADHALIADTSAHFRRHGMPSEVAEAMSAEWVAMGHRVEEPTHVTTVDDGEQVDLGGRVATLRWTPGHTDYHAVLFEPAEGILYAGDHVLPRISSNVGWYTFSRDDPLGDFLGSLEAVARLPVRRVLPAHGEPFDDLRGRVDELHAHHAGRLAATLEAIGPGRTAYAICRMLFPRLRSAAEERFALAETLAHLRHLERTGRVVTVAGDPITWRAI